MQIHQFFLFNLEKLKFIFLFCALDFGATFLLCQRVPIKKGLVDVDEYVSREKGLGVGRSDGGRTPGIDEDIPLH